MAKCNFIRCIFVMILAVLISVTAESATTVKGTINVDTKWTLTGSPYVVSESLTLAEGKTLTIDPGVIVKVARYCSITIQGTLSANGTAEQPIYFTSYLDDTVGGDTNGDGSGSVPARDNWGHLRITSVSTGSVLNYAVIRYGGYYTSANLTVETSSITISNCTSEESSKHGIYVSNAAPVITGCTLKNNAQHGIFLTIGSSNAALSNNTVTGNGSYPNAIVLESGTMTKPSVFKAQNAAYVISNVTVDKTITWTVEPGAVVKISNYCSIVVNGTLIADGTPQQPIYFTSVLDDTAMGDTNGDQGNSTPSRGVWGQITFSSESKNSILDNTVIRYSGYYSSANVYSESTSLTISSSVIEESSQHGIHVSNASPAVTGNQIKNNSKNGVYVTSDSKASITGNTITGNGWYAIAMEGAAVNSLVQNNTITGKSNGILLSKGTITAPQTFSQQGASYVMDTITVGEGAVLTINASVAVKIIRYTSVTVNGTVIASGTSAQPVYITSILDDTVGGDTNGDGGNSGPSRDNWGQIYFTPLSKNNKLDYTVIRYGGYYTSANLVIATSSFTMNNSVVEEGSHHGVYVTAASPSFSGNTFKNNSQYGIYLTIDSAGTSLTNNTLSGNGSNQGGIGIATGVIRQSVTFNAQNAVYIMGDVTIAEGVVLKVLPGAVVKIPRYTSITVHGTVIADGTSDNPIYFTSILDDAAGGDTNGDGAGSVPGRDNWGHIRFSSASRNNVLNYVTIRYGGYYQSSNLLLETSSMTISNSVVEEGSHHGIHISSASPTISTSIIRNNSQRGIYLSGTSAASITRTAFNQNGWDAVFMEIGSIHSFYKDNTVSKNGTNAISIGGGKIDSSAVLRNPPGIVYVVSGSITVPEGVSLKIDPGVVVKFARYLSLTVDGTMNAPGTASDPIYFTSLMDDTILGDTNNDGDNSKPARDNWGWLRFTPLSRNNILSYATVRYGGYYSTSNVNIETTSMTMTNCVVEEGSHHGVYVTGAAPVITGCTLKNNSQHGLLLAVDSAHTTLSDNTVSGNGSYPNGIVYAQGTVTKPVVFRSQNAVFVFGSVTIDQGVSLTIEPGAVVKIPRYCSLTFNGTLIANGTSDKPIYMTSVLDDTVGGDTNGDGSGSAPARDNWGHLLFTSLSVNNVLNNVVIRYGGYYTSANVTIESPSLSLTNSIVEEGSHNGITISKAKPFIMGCLIRNNSGHGIEMVSAEPLILSNTISGNNGKGIHNQTPIAVDARHNFWGDPTGPKDASDDTGTGGLYNPNGKGSLVSDYVTYQPWLDYSPHQLADRTDPILLTENTPYQGTLSSRQITDFVFQAEQGRSLLIEVTPQNNILTAIFDGRLGALVAYPSLGDYTVRQVTVQGKYEILIPSADGKPYYFSLFGQEVADPSGQYAITARYVDKHLSDASPKQAGNAGNCTIALTGLGFTAGMKAELRLGTAVLTSSEIQVSSSSEAAVWFNLSEAALGKYSISLIWPNAERKILTDGFTIVQGLGSRLEAVLVPPPAVRPGRSYTVWLEYKNAGDADMFSPLMTVKSNCPLSVDKDKIASSQEVQVLGVGKSANPGILRIGESGRIPIYFNVTTSEPRITFNLFVTEDNFDPVDWYAQKTIMTPLDLPAAEWEAMWSRLPSRLGNTWAQYLKVLRQNAVILKQRKTEPYDVKKLIRLEARKAAGLPAAAVSGVLKDEITHLPIQGVPIKAANADSSVVVQSDTSYPDGFFVLEDLPNGTVGLYVEGYQLSAPVSVELSGNQDQNGLVLYAKKVLPHEAYQESTAKIFDHNPYPASDGANRLFMVWERNSDIWWAVNNGAGWNRYGKIPGAVGYNPVLVYHSLMKNNGPGLFCAWETGDTVKTVKWAAGTPSQDGSISWSAVQSMTSDAYDDFGIAAAAAQNGQPLILWLQKNSAVPDDSDIYYLLIDLAASSQRSLETEQPELEEIVTPRGIERCTEIKWPPGDFEGLTLPSWIPIIGGKSGVSIFGKACGEEGCSTSQSGKVGVEVKIGEKYGVSGEGAIQAKWITDKKKCIYVFSEGSLSYSLGGKLEIPSTPVPIVIVGIPIIGALPIGTGQIVGTINLSSTSNMTWKSNFPGLPTHGNVDITFGGDLKGKVLLKTGIMGGDVTGGISGTIEIKTPPLTSGFKEYCITLTGTGSIGWGCINRSWTKKWGSCAAGRFLPRNVSEKDQLIQGGCWTVDGITVCEEVQMLKEAFSGTTAVYESNPAFSPDVVNDGNPAAAVSGTGEILMVWAKDETPAAALGSKLYSSVFQNNKWQTPVDITPKADFNKDAAVVFDSGNTPMAVWSRASADKLTFDDSFVQDILNASEKADLYFSRRVSGTWTEPAPIAELPGTDEMPAAAAGPNGEITVVWQNTNGNGMTLYASVFNGTNWSEPAAISTSAFASSPKAAYLSGKPTVVWAADINHNKDVSGDWRILSSTWDGSAWSAPSQIKTETASRLIRSAAPRTLRSAAPPKECCDKKDDDPKPPDPPKKPAGGAGTPKIVPVDPNEKVAATGVGDLNYVTVEERLTYKVYFENKSTAQAPAQEVFVTDFLDFDLDWTTIRMEEVSFGKVLIANTSDHPMLNAKVNMVDYRDPAVLWQVEIRSVFESQNGCLKVSLHTLDPDTGDLPEDAFAGLLPPEDGTGRGQGSFTFTIYPKKDRATGTVIKNAATIIFDTEAPIVTNEVVNMITDQAPIAGTIVPATPSNSQGVDVNTLLGWSSCDFASSYSVYVWKASDPKPTSPTASNLKSTFYDPEHHLSYDTVYKWQVAATNVKGTSVSEVWSFTTTSYPYLRDAVVVLETLAGIDLGDISYVPDVDGNTRRGLQEVIYFIQKAAELR